jgi:formamidopyrimidine-DNA glycosylase
VAGINQYFTRFGAQAALLSLRDLNALCDVHLRLKGLIDLSNERHECGKRADLTAPFSKNNHLKDQKRGNDQQREGYITIGEQSNDQQY